MHLKAIGLGIKKNWRSGIPASILKVWGVCWLLTNSTAFFWPAFKTFVEDHTVAVVVISTCIAIIYAVQQAAEVLRVTFPIKTTNTKITLRFGDLFDCKGHIVVPVNEFFDSEIGKPVALKSVHGQFIHRVLGGDSSKFNSDVDRYLGTCTGREIVERSVGRQHRYPIGTTAVLTEGTRKCFLFALTKTNPETCEASADVPQLWQALLALWKCVRTEANGDRICLPLVGGRLARLNLELLRLCLLTTREIWFLLSGRRPQIGRSACGPLR